MIFGLMLDSDETEEKLVCQYIRELTAYQTEEKLEIKIFHKNEPLIQQMEKMDLLDLAIIDVTLSGALDGAREIRRKFSKTEILVIADFSISPMEYMNPSIRASSLLLRPMTEGWKNAIHDFFSLLLKHNEKDSDEEVLWIKNTNGTFRIPYGQIYYLEARDKKIFIRTKAEEYGINGTIEKILEQLPANFVRCHRSFVVNTDCITQIKMNENLIYLGSALFVPVSRSYKSVFKRQMQ